VRGGGREEVDTLQDLIPRDGADPGAQGCAGACMLTLREINHACSRASEKYSLSIPMLAYTCLQVRISLHVYCICLSA
jgi:hypothetical protein